MKINSVAKALCKYDSLYSP